MSRPAAWAWGVHAPGGAVKARGTAATMGTAQAAAQEQMSPGDTAVVESAGTGRRWSGRRHGPREGDFTWERQPCPAARP